MKTNVQYSYVPEVEQQILNDMLSPELALDPYAFAMYAFPWNKKGTPLEGIPGPRAWQKEVMQEIAHHCRRNAGNIQKALEAVGLRNGPELYQGATASGRGVGKSALIAMLSLWQMSCHLGSTCIITANSESQLRDRTFAELQQWLTLAINRHWFVTGAMSIQPAPWFAEAIRNDLSIDSTYYAIRGQLWSDERPDSFAGAHNRNGLMVLFDESSGIPQSIFDITRGFFTEPSLHRYWMCFGNPRRDSGPFYECFKSGQRQAWHARQIDGRSVEGTDPALYQSYIDKHGLDSDVVRTEVLGQFPSSTSDSFILREAVQRAVERQVEFDDGAPLILGADIARFGSDSTVLRFRQGRNARFIPPIKIRNADNMKVARVIAKAIDTYRPDAVCIDASATGVIDRLREQKYTIHAVDFGGKAENDEYANIRTEIWAAMRDWLHDGAIDADPDLIEDLAAPSYRYQANSDRLMLERKDELRKRGFRSPDDGDALACTFAVRVARRDMPGHRGRRRSFIVDGAGETAQDPFGDDQSPPSTNQVTQGDPTPERMRQLAKGRRPRFASDLGSGDD